MISLIPDYTLYYFGSRKIPNLFKKLVIRATISSTLHLILNQLNFTKYTLFFENILTSSLVKPKPWLNEKKNNLKGIQYIP